MPQPSLVTSDRSAGVKALMRQIPVYPDLAMAKGLAIDVQNKDRHTSQRHRPSPEDSAPPSIVSPLRL